MVLIRRMELYSMGTGMLNRQNEKDEDENP